MVLAHIGPLLGRQELWHSSKTAETPVPIIARGVVPTPDLYSSGPEPMALLLSQTSKCWDFRQKLPCPALVSHFPSHSSGGPPQEGPS